MLDEPRFNYHKCAVQALSIAALGSMLLLLSSGASGQDRHLPPDARLESVVAPRLVVLKSRRIAHLFDGARLVRSFPVDLGINPLGQKTRDGDGRTPEGRFRIVTRHPSSAYRGFLGINYPDPPAADAAAASGLLSAGEAESIRRAWREGRCPSWVTALGGGIGLHGGGRGADWTAGCVALRDADIDALYRVLRIGDPVEIWP
ncbi:MAG: hypothetical protein FLDDKLPJ_00324 [Phycisphaerae bacterium]|nr:hypothetical protein [Phycisphaerae bacterium]